MLEKLGYTVYVAKSGLEAIEILTKRKEEINMVVLDLIMPGMDGEKTFNAIREFAPQIAILLSSGYSINGQVMGILKKGCNGFIQKPFNISEFSRKVREILDN
jgi:CheY-like chemotaxis protein